MEWIYVSFALTFWYDNSIDCTIVSQSGVWDNVHVQYGMSNMEAILSVWAWNKPGKHWYHYGQLISYLCNLYSYNLNFHQK